MASSDITVSGLSKIGNENAEYLVSKIRTIPGFPQGRYSFFVISCLFWQMRVPSDCYLTHSKPRCRSLPMNSISSQVWKPADSFFGPALAARLGKGFIAVRKAGKLPPETVSESYDLEYGQATVEIETNIVHEGISCACR